MVKKYVVLKIEGIKDLPGFATGYLYECFMETDNVVHIKRMDGCKISVDKKYCIIFEVR